MLRADEEDNPHRCGSRRGDRPRIERYEKEREGLGFELWGELITAIDGLEDPGPECGPVIGLPPELGVRRKLLSRFLYTMFFVVGDTFVRVISVTHGHRRPAYWRRRLWSELLEGPGSFEGQRSLCRQ